MKSPVRLQPLSLADEREFIEAAVRSKVLHGSWVSPPLTPVAFRRMAERGPADLSFLVRRADDARPIGYIGVTNIVRGVFQSAYLGYYAFAGHEGQGLMRAGLRALVRYAFIDLKLHRLEANVQPTNTASIALVRSCGFQREGYSPRYLKIRGHWRDHERWAILAR